jgi:hypothetical protein
MPNIEKNKSTREVGPSTPYPPSLDDWRFVVVDCEEEEEVKKLKILWRKQGKAREGEGVILTRRGTVRRLCPYPPPYYCQYVPLDCASGSVSGANPSKTTRRLSIMREGEGAGQWCRAHLSTAVAKLRHLFNFHLLFYYMVEVPSSTFNPRRLLQLQSSSPTSSLVAFNFNPRCQLHP